METETSVAQAEPSAPAIVHNPREQWLLRRRGLVTASDVPAILGVDPYRKPADVYAEKLGLAADDDSSNWPLIYGTEFQHGVGRAYSRHTGRAVRMVSLEIPELTVHPDLAWLGASLDGEAESSEKLPAPATGPGALEVKVSSIAGTWDEDELPVRFQLQVTVQAACSQKFWGAIAAFVSLRKPPRHQDILFDRELFDLMVPKLEAFHRSVQRREPPTDDLEWWSGEAIRRVFAVGGEPIALDGEALEIAEAWEDAKAQRKEAEAAADALGDRLRLRMGAAPIGYLPDGSQLTLKTVAGGHVEYDREPYRRLLRTKRGRK